MRLPQNFTHKESNAILYLLESEAHVPERCQMSFFAHRKIVPTVHSFRESSSTNPLTSDRRTRIVSPFVIVCLRTVAACCMMARRGGRTDSRTARISVFGQSKMEA